MKNSLPISLLPTKDSLVGTKLVTLIDKLSMLSQPLKSLSTKQESLEEATLSNVFLSHRMDLIFILLF
jgi:hypothetical protein